MSYGRYGTPIEAEKMMTVDRLADRGWVVLDGAGNVIRDGFETNAEAWRWVDRRTGELVSRSEHVAAWVWSQLVYQAVIPQQYQRSEHYVPSVDMSYAKDTTAGLSDDADTGYGGRRNCFSPPLRGPPVPYKTE
jgi:hypothetical protein